LVERLEDRTAPAVNTLFGAPLLTPLAFGPSALEEAVGNFTNDLIPDVALLDQTASSPDIVVLPGRGDGTFQAPVHSTFMLNRRYFSPVTADFNADGKFDLAVLADNSVSGAPAGFAVLLGNGDGTFQAPVDFAAGDSFTRLAVGNFNADLMPDLVAVSQSTSTVGVFLNTAAPKAAAPSFAASGFYDAPSPQAVAVGDFTGDHMDDVAVASTAFSQVRVFLNKGDGSGTFALGNAIGIYPVTENPLALAVGDFDGQGGSDVGHAGRGGDIAALHNNGTGVFTGGAGVPIDFTSLLAAADFNGDGKDDLAAADGVLQPTATVSNYVVRVVLGDVSPTSPAGDFPVDMPQPGAPPPPPSSFAVADFNGDGAPDLAVVNSGPNFPSPTLTILLNQSGTKSVVGSTANPADASQPFNLTATVSGVFQTGAPTGNVTFKEGNTVLGVRPLSGGVATLMISAGGLSAGMHTIMAVYGGDANFHPGTSAPFVQTVAVLSAGDPVITGLSTDRVVEGFGAVSLTFSGTNFVSGSTARAGAVSLSTFFVSATQLQVTIPAALVNEDGALTLTVVNPGGATSNARTLTVVDAPLGVNGMVVTLPRLLPAGALATYLLTQRLPPTTPFSGVVATFTDTSAVFETGAYTASIDWGDGISAGTVQFQGGTTAAVVGSHTYTAPGRYTIRVTVRDEGGSSNQAASSAVIGSLNERFLAQAYRDLLIRPLDLLGLAIWNDQFDHGATRAQVALGIERTKEYRGLQVQALYGLLLHHAPGPRDLSDGIAFLLGGGPVEQLAEAVAGLPEYYQNRAGNSPVGFLVAIFGDTVHRTPFPSEFFPLLAQLNGGAPRSVVAAFPFNLFEYKVNLVQSFYQAFLHHAADALGPGYVNDLLTGTPDEVVMSKILGGDEYANRL
jgi:hypothetical protein